MIHLGMVDYKDIVHTYAKRVYIASENYTARITVNQNLTQCRGENTSRLAALVTFYISLHRNVFLSGCLAKFAELKFRSSGLLFETPLTHLGASKQASSGRKCTKTTRTLFGTPKN